MATDQPNSIETIVCLANSRKISGRCIAGKRLEDKSWMRPVSSRPGHEICEDDRRYQDGRSAQLLDIIEIPCVGKQPNGFQSENVLIDDRFYWTLAGKATWAQVNSLVDREADLWANGYSAFYNTNNRVPEALVDNSAGSLRLIKLDQIKLHAAPKAPEFGNMKLIVRASFDYRGEHYQLDLTDPLFEKACLEKGAGDYTANDLIACISLGELFTNQKGETFAYKLVASIITSTRAGS